MMTRIFLLMLLSTIAYSLTAQTYRLTHVSKELHSSCTFTHWKNLDGGKDKFTVWNQKEYGDYLNVNESPYKEEIEYYAGDPAETYQFLTTINSLIEKNQEEKEIASIIQGYMVKLTRSKSKGSVTLMLYSKDRRIVQPISEKRLNEMIEKFVEYCVKENVSYEQ